MSHTIEATDVVVDEISSDDGREMFGALVLDRLGIGREEFLRRLDAGDYDDTDSEEVIRLRLLAPFAR